MSEKLESRVGTFIFLVDRIQMWDIWLSTWDATARYQDTKDDGNDSFGDSHMKPSLSIGQT